MLFQLSSIVMITSGDESRFEAWVFDARNGKPEQGVPEVALYKRSWDEQKFTVKTLAANENGLAVFEHPGNFTALVVARKGPILPISILISIVLPNPATKSWIISISIGAFTDPANS